MQNVLDLNEYSVAEMQYAEMEQTEGGIIPWLVAGACLLLASCSNSQTSVQVNTGSGSNSSTSSPNASASADSTANGNQTKVK